MEKDFRMPQPPRMSPDTALNVAGQEHLQNLLGKRDQKTLRRIRKEDGPVAWRVYAIKRTIRQLISRATWFANLTWGDWPGLAETRRRYGELAMRTIALAWLTDRDGDDLHTFFTGGITNAIPLQDRVKRSHQATVHAPRMTREASHFLQFAALANGALYCGYDGMTLQVSGFAEPLAEMLKALREMANFAGYNEQQLEEKLADAQRRYWGITR